MIVSVTALQITRIMYTHITVIITNIVVYDSACHTALQIS